MEGHKHDSAMRGEGKTEGDKHGSAVRGKRNVSKAESHTTYARKTRKKGAALQGGRWGRKDEVFLSQKVTTKQLVCCIC